MGLPKLVDDALALPSDEREELAMLLLDSLEPPAGLSLDDGEDFDRRTAAAFAGDDPGVPWDELRRSLEGRVMTAPRGLVRRLPRAR